MNASGTASYGVGQLVRRKEDLHLLTGRGRYVDDRAPPSLAHAVVVRSPHATPAASQSAFRRTR